MGEPSGPTAELAARLELVPGHTQGAGRSALALLDAYLEAPVGLCMVDRDLRYLYINRLLAAAHDLSIEGHIGEPLRDFLPPELADRVIGEFQKILDGQETYIEAHFHLNRPKPVEYLLCLRPVANSEGDIVAVSAVVKDVTETRLSRRLLQHQNRILRAIAEGKALVGILEELIDLLQDFSGARWIFVEAHRFGDRLAGRTIAGSWPPGELESLVRSADRIQASEGEDRSSLPAGVRWVPVRDKEGDLLGSFIVRIGDQGPEASVNGPAVEAAVDLARIAIQRQRTESSFRLTQTAVDCSQEGAFWFREDNTIFYVNDAACRSLGYEREELLGKTFREFDVGITLSASWNGRERLERDGKLRFETLHRAKDGRVFPVVVTVDRVEFDGQVYFISSSHDISARQSEKQRRVLSEIRYQALAATAPVGIFRWDAEAGCVFMNPRGAEIMGYPADELLGDGWQKALHEDDREWVVEAWEEAQENPAPTTFELRYRKASGGVSWVTFHAAPEPNPETGKTGWVGTITEITERKEAETRLNRLLEATVATTGSDFFRSLVKQLAQVLEVEQTLVAELHGDGTGFRILALWDGEECHALPSLPLDKGPWRSILEADRYFLREGGAGEAFDTCLLQQALSFESCLGVPLVHSSGRPLGILALLGRNPLKASPEILSLLSVFASRAAAELARLHVEESERKMEAQIQHTQKLESLGVLAGGIAHDFNNLLGGILGNAELATMNLSPGHPCRPLLEDISRGAQRSAELSRQMLAYSGKGQFLVEMLDLSELVDEMSKLLRSSLSRRAELSLDLAEDLPAVQGDGTQLRQVVMNLLTNASDALEDKTGTVRLSTGTVQLTETEIRGLTFGEGVSPGLHVFLEVSDTGQGMSRETQGRLFEPFFTTRFTGRGLGMAVVHGILRGHKGGIRVRSLLGRGTTVRVFFRGAMEEEEAARPAAPAAPSRASRGLALVVDDEDLIRNLAARMLKNSGFEVEEAEDGRVALEAFARRPDEFALVLLDLTMPVLDGAETLKELRAIREDLPVILSSGYNEQAASGDLNSEGVVFLQKPYRPRDLEALVEKLLTPASS